MRRVPAYNNRLVSAGASSICASSQRRRERGQSLIEAVFSMIMLLTVLFGIIQCSLAVYSYHFIAFAAREGARWAMVRGSACTNGTGGSCTATGTDIQNYVKGLGFPGIDTSAMTVAVTCGANGSNPATPASTCVTPNNDPGDLVRVAITYTFPLGIPFVPTNIITMKSSSQMTISQ